MTGDSVTAIITVDLGGTTIKGALIDVDGQTHALSTVPTFAPNGGDALAGLQRVLDTLVIQAPKHGLRVEGAGIVVPGIVSEAGEVAFSANLGWRNLPLRALIEQRLNMPVAIGHDVSAAGLAESLFGAARGQTHFAMVTIGTGIAACLMSDGRLIRGIGNGAGEIGHVPVLPDGEICACGQRGCMEAYASAASIARRYRALGGCRAETAAEIGTLLGTDPVADLVWSDAIRALSLGLATATMMLDPALIVLGGGLSLAGGVLLDPLRNALSTLLVWRSPPPLAVSLLGADAGRIGAATLGYRAIGRDEAIQGWSRDALLTPPVTTI